MNTIQSIQVAIDQRVAASALPIPRARVWEARAALRQVRVWIDEIKIARGDAAQRTDDLRRAGVLTYEDQREIAAEREAATRHARRQVRAWARRARAACDLLHPWAA